MRIALPSRRAAAERIRPPKKVIGAECGATSEHSINTADANFRRVGPSVGHTHFSGNNQINSPAPFSTSSPSVRISATPPLSIAI